MTKISSTAANYRFTRRSLMLATAAGATLAGGNEAFAEKPKFPMRMQKALKSIQEKCDRSCALLGETKLVELLGSEADGRSKTFVNVLQDGLDNSGPEEQDEMLIKALMEKLGEAKTATGNAVYYRDFYTKSKAEWGGGKQNDVIAAMDAGKHRFAQPHFLYLQETESETRNYQIRSVLDGWTKEGRDVAGFLDLCAEETVIRAFTVHHTDHPAGLWIDYHLYPWLLRRNAGWMHCMDVMQYGDEQPPVMAAENAALLTSGRCAAFVLGVPSAYTCFSADDMKCGLVGGQPGLGTDFCDPPESP